MLTLATSNPAKYAPFARDLERLRITIEPPAQPLPEIQSLNFAETLTAKARAAAASFGRPVLVDDTGLVLDAYAPFPGPLTATVLRSLGTTGLRRLLSGASDRASMECHLGCWLTGALRNWKGVVQGRVDLSRQPRDERMPLSDLFVPDTSEAGQGHEHASPGQPLLLHRARALAALEGSMFELHLETTPSEAGGATLSAMRAGYDCPFCAEFEHDTLSIYAGMLGDRL